MCWCMCVPLALSLSHVKSDYKKTKLSIKERKLSCLVINSVSFYLHLLSNSISVLAFAPKTQL